jgi:parallel beta-helix repeat protein
VFHSVTQRPAPSFCTGDYYTRPLLSPSRTPKMDQCAYWDSSLDPRNPMAVDPQMVFRDGAYLDEVSSLSQVSAGTFYYEQDTAAKRGRLFLGADPNGHYTEVTARPSALSVAGANTKILGIGFSRYATNLLGSLTSGALFSLQATGLLVENSAFVANAGPGFSGSLQEGVVRHSLFVRNGANGISSNGHFRAGTKDNALIEASLFDGNNAERFNTACTASCTVANIKLNHMIGFTVRNNIIDRARGNAKGVWCDLACTNGVIVNNSVNGNGSHGIFYEVSDRGVIASNLVTANGGRGITVASANTKVYNNTLVGQLASIFVYDDGRSLRVDGWTDVGPDTRGVEVANNVVSGRGNVVHCRPPLQAPKNKAPNTGCDQIFSRLDHNVYLTVNGVASYQFRALGEPATTTYRTMSAFRSAYGLDKNSEARVLPGTPSVDTVKAAGAGTGIRVPADVAAAIGVAGTATLKPGAVTYPGQ